jgi:hypothetical protein
MPGQIGSIIPSTNIFLTISWSFALYSLIVAISVFGDIFIYLSIYIYLSLYSLIVAISVFGDIFIHTWAPDFFRGGGQPFQGGGGGGGGKICRPHFNGHFFSKKNIFEKKIQKNSKK